MTPNADHTAWTITVRPNVVFHDGTPCDGAALLTNFEAQKASLLLGTLILVPILDSLTQSGPNSVTLTFKSPWVSFPLYLAGGIGGQSAYMCAPSMLSAPNGGTSQPVGTGPFVFKEWVPNSHFTATANPHYWRPGLPYLDEITFKPIIDENARAEALKSGTIDIMVTDTPQIITQFRGNKQYAYIDDSTHLVGEPDMNCILLNLAAEPFNNPSVRRAAAMAINRAQYAKEIDDNVLPVSDGLFTPGSPYYSTTAYPSYNPTEAKKLVKQVEKSTGKPVSFTFGSTNGPAAVREQEYLQQAWQDVGFVVKNTIVEQNDLINNALAGTVRGPRVAAVRRRRPRPQLHLLEHHHHPLEQPFHQYGPQHRPPTPGRARARPPELRPGCARQGLPDGQQAPRHRPALPLDRPRRVVRREHTQGPELEQPHDAERRTGLRDDRRLHLADADLVELSRYERTHSGGRGRRTDPFVDAPRLSRVRATT